MCKKKLRVSKIKAQVCTIDVFIIIDKYLFNTELVFHFATLETILFNTIIKYPIQGDKI